MSEDLIEGGPIAVLAELDRLRVEGGGSLTSRAVLTAAEHPASPLHDHFEWSDTAAAERYRLQQAGALIRRFRIVRRDGDRVVSVPAFTRVDGDGYRETREVVSREMLRDQHRARLMMSLQRLASELAAFEEFAGVVDAIEDLP